MKQNRKLELIYCLSYGGRWVAEFNDKEFSRDGINANIVGSKLYVNIPKDMVQYSINNFCEYIQRGEKDHTLTIQYTEEDRIDVDPVLAFETSTITVCSTDYRLITYDVINPDIYYNRSFLCLECNIGKRTVETIYHDGARK